jgi:hypothetical protein
MKPEHRAKLLEIAAARNEKGFSSLVAEAIELYLTTRAQRNAALKAAVRTEGSLSARDAETLRSETLRLRSEWR